MLTKDDLEQIGKVIDKRLETHTTTLKAEIAASEKRIRADMATKVDLAELEKSIRTDMATKADIQNLRAEMATKADVQDLKAAVTKKLKSHEQRLNALEDEVGVPHPDKN